MPARLWRVSPAARAQRASSEGRMSRSYSCVPRGIRPRRYSAPTIASRKDLRLRLMVETNRRSEEHTSELQSQSNLVCRLLLEKKKNNKKTIFDYKKQNAANSYARDNT